MTFFLVQLTFYIVFFIGSFLLIITDHLIYSLLILIGLYVLTAGFLIINGFDFLGFILLIVYIGAIAMLFLFVIMLVNVSIINVQITENFFQRHLLLFLLLNSCYFIYLDLFFSFGFLFQHILITSTWLSNVLNIAITLYSMNFYIYILLIGLFLLLILFGILTLAVHETIEKKDFL